MIRSPRLLALGLAMLASAGLLAVLHHDGEVGVADPTQAAAGEAVRLKGELLPFVPPARDPAWMPVLALLQNQTAILPQDDGALLVLVTAPSLRDVPGSVVVDGVVAFSGPHPTDAARRLVVLRDAAIDAPLLFR